MLRLVAIFLIAAGMLTGANESSASDAVKLVESARKQIGVTLGYDPNYRKLSYPGGDVPIDTGVCTDVVIRALRNHGIDLQSMVHEDMKSNFSVYPKNWKLPKPDSNIDHRRVPNLQVFFSRRRIDIPVTKNSSDYLPGDFVTWDLRPGLPHIGVVSERKSWRSVPLVIHNIGQGTQEEDILFTYKITGHYRWFGKK